MGLGFRVNLETHRSRAPNPLGPVRLLLAVWAGAAKTAAAGSAETLLPAVEVGGEVLYFFFFLGGGGRAPSSGK